VTAKKYKTDYLNSLTASLFLKHTFYGKYTAFPYNTDINPYPANVENRVSS